MSNQKFIKVTNRAGEKLFLNTLRIKEIRMGKSGKYFFVTDDGETYRFEGDLSEYVEPLK